MTVNKEERYSKYFRRWRSGSLEACFREAERLGYKLREKTDKRASMQYKNKDFWATITETGEPTRPWEFVTYKCRPKPCDPQPKTTFLKRVQQYL